MRGTKRWGREQRPLGKRRTTVAQPGPRTRLMVLNVSAASFGRSKVPTKNDSRSELTEIRRTCEELRECEGTELFRSMPLCRAPLIPSPCPTAHVRVYIEVRILVNEVSLDYCDAPATLVPLDVYRDLEVELAAFFSLDESNASKKQRDEKIIDRRNKSKETTKKCLRTHKKDKRITSFHKDSQHHNFVASDR
ncbi:hypothetical protein EAG_09928 [Camponotus floridanus]|uniref:Uncharacterized protein n=1 Tax=Camponotus floridanus TaxID=104421 RepID=E2A6F3_CAMFO|nr:hypothetical protein EAG_09928 [Camponotus floridanus]